MKPRTSPSSSAFALASFSRPVWHCGPCYWAHDGRGATALYLLRACIVAHHVRFNTDKKASCRAGGIAMRTQSNGWVRSDFGQCELANSHSTRTHLWQPDVSDCSHPFLPLLLFLQQLHLPCDIAAVALGRHILAQRLDRLPGHNPAFSGGLVPTVKACVYFGRRR